MNNNLDNKKDSNADDSKVDYKNTLNLPKTDFPMKASLTEQEPKRLARWEKEGLYKEILKGRDISKRYILHDGPPYANGNIHIGTALNKILKDFIVKLKTAQGYYSPYIPGWDCHGLPIELHVDKELGEKKANMTKSQIRKVCRKYAQKWIDVQRASFKRLGVNGDWDHPYITMDHVYESITLSEFYKVLKAGNVYKGSKPVYWCPSCVTALAEAEVEYHDHTSLSVFVKFPMTDESCKKLNIPLKTAAVIWTTTPWTLPANLGISANPTEQYYVMKIDQSENDNLKQGEHIIVAAAIVDKAVSDKDKSLKERFGVNSWTVVSQFEGKALDRLEATHPFLDRKSLLMVGDHVTMEDGTGLVHTAPGHGQEDYIIGLEYGLEVLNPVDDYGKFRADLPLFGGEHINDANPKIVEYLKGNGALILAGKIKHSYPHCWRCKKPVIYRATPQWFISMEANDLRKKALSAIKNDIRWIPTWGENRIYAMIENRPDWCVSRQRTWGVPIALFTCRNCDTIIFNDEIEKKIVDSFVESGADAWFDHDTEYYLGKGHKCPKCGSDDIRKETDILDVWFDSGTSHAAVCETRKELGGSADMYLEGSDQHRGWFHSSLLESVATRGVPPFKEVLTHGFVVDGDGKKMSKSEGNVITAEELVKQHGAEILRLWVSGEDYSEDIRISQDILKRLVESYRKIRNTARYILGSINDFNPDTDMVPFEQMKELDKYVLLRWQDSLKRIYEGFENYQFHVFYHTFLNFCINDLSAFYLDIIKDRAYSSGTTSLDRRSAQTAMFILSKEIAVVIAPVLSFTADEIWDYLPNWKDKSKFVFQELFPPVDRYNIDKIAKKFEKLAELRKVVNKALEIARAEKLIGHPLDAKVYIGLSKDMQPATTIDEGLSRLLIVSEVEIVNFDSLSDAITNDEKTIRVKVEPSNAEKCPRCWTRSTDIGVDAKHPTLCKRCAEVLG